MALIPLKSKGRLPIYRVDKGIFTDRYYARCMENKCRDLCCSYGCPMEPIEIERIMEYRGELEKRLGKNSTQWFGEEEDDSNYPSGRIKNTKVYNGQCVFHDWSFRGCLLHRLALEKGMEPRKIKPMVCFIFPLSWHKGCLFVSGFMNELPCYQQGGLILDTILPEIKHYHGEKAASEIEALSRDLSRGLRPLYPHVPKSKQPVYLHR